LMPESTRSRLSTATQLYALAIFGLGIAVIYISILDIHALGLRDPRWHLDWLRLAGLTLISGWLSVKLPSRRATISISETFVLAGAVLYGPGVGAVLVALDAAVLCTKEFLLGRGLRREQVAFNVAAPAVSIWFAAMASGLTGPASASGLTPGFVLQLAVFTALYFLLNSGLVTIAISLEQHEGPWKIWWANFRELWINFAAGASIAAFAANAKGVVNLAFIGVIVPLLVVIYVTYSWSTKRVQVEKDKNLELNRVFLSTVEALALAIDAKDQVTHGHIRRVQRYTMGLAEALGVRDEKQLDALRAAALLHDTGKLAVPEYILNKPGPLTASEFERMKIHAAVGADILKSIDFPYPVEPIVRHHHEAWDGSGYPSGLKGQDIPLGARILSVVDCYDALTSDRPYRPRMTRAQAEEVLRDRRGKAYDPWIVDRFLEILAKLEAGEAKEGQQISIVERPLSPTALQLDVITATTAEEREFNELRRDLPRSTSLAEATEVLYRHLRRVVPVAAIALYRPRVDANDIAVVAACGVGASAMDGMAVPISERISGWVFAHGQSVLNSDATLELGPIARTFQTPLRYVAAVPIVDGQVVAVLAAFGTEPFDKDHKRLLENASTLFVSSLGQPIHSEQAPANSERVSGPTTRRVH
jgi:putative nucleotidyltransferase with HDIG domain